GVAREFQSARRPQLLTIKQRRAKSSFRALQWIHQRCREVVALLRAGRGRPLGDAEFSEQELEIQPSGLWAHPRRTCWGSPRRPFRRGHLVRQSLCGGYVASAKLRSWGYQASPLRSLRERARDAAWHRAWECSAKFCGTVSGGSVLLVPGVSRAPLVATVLVTSSLRVCVP
ncbi:unnamed protein product, partial [Prorocentrum cordatum]